MTTLVLNYSSSILESVAKIFKEFSTSIIMARQLSANQEAAKWLSDTEYNGAEYARILFEMNTATRKHYGR